MCPPDIGLYLQYKRNQPQAQTKLIIKTWNYPNENQSDYQDMIIRRQDFILLPFVPRIEDVYLVLL